jgi:HD-like signal output (HDOD) protein
MRLLFVDDEPQVQRGMQRMMEAACADWECIFVGSGADALNALQSANFDAIVSDMRMPKMDGAQLLDEVSRRHPEVIRIVLSGQIDKGSVFRAVNSMHQYLAKPCSGEILRSALLRASALRKVLRSEALDQLIGGVTSLPSMPDLYLQLQKEIESENRSAAAVGRILSQDPGMTAKILKLANSAIFGLTRAVSSATEATSLLGMETIKSLVLTAGVFRTFEGSTANQGMLDALFEHSLQTARFSSLIAKAEKLRSDAVQEAFTAGLLHDVGKLVLIASAPHRYQQALAAAHERNLPQWRAEHDVLGASHAELGAHLLSMWGLPQGSSRSSRCITLRSKPTTANSPRCRPSAPPTGSAAMARVDLRNMRMTVGTDTGRRSVARIVSRRGTTSVQAVWSDLR